MIVKTIEFLKDIKENWRFYIYQFSMRNKEVPLFYLCKHTRKQMMWRSKNEKCIRCSYNAQRRFNFSYTPGVFINKNLLT